jgi:regulator of nucleoside diphosphate kinase
MYHDSSYVVPSHDQARIITSIDRAREWWESCGSYWELLRAKLKRARVVPPADVPPDRITMNSRFALVHEGSQDFICYTLVYPEHESLLHGQLSVLSPIGQAVYGAKVGDRVYWGSRSGHEAAKVHKLHYQPEAAGDHHL